MKTKFPIVCSLLISSVLSSQGLPEGNTEVKEPESTAVASLPVYRKALPATDVRVKARAEIASKIFSLMGRAIEKVDIDLFMEAYSHEEALDHVQKRVKMKLNKKFRRLHRDNFELSNSRKLGQMEHLAEPYKNAEIVRIQEIDADHFIAYSRGWNSRSGSYIKYKYWFCRDAKKKLGWATYDFEDLDQGFKSSTMTALMLPAPTKELRQWSPVFKDFLAAQRNYKMSQKEYFGKLGALANRLLKIDSIPDAVRRMATVSVADQKAVNGQFEEALNLLDKADQLADGSPAILLKKAKIKKEQGKFKESEKLYLEYVHFMGLDSEVCRELAILAEKRGDLEQARIYASEGFRLNEKNLEMLLRYGLLTDEAGRKEVVKRLSELEQGHTVFFALVKVASEEGKADAWEWYFKQYSEKYRYEKERIKYLKEEAEKLLKPGKAE